LSRKTLQFKHVVAAFPRYAEPTRETKRKENAMMAAIIICLLVLFGALLAGKMLIDLYPRPLFGASREQTRDDTSSHE
jgi:hypothetical protein